MSDPNFVLGSQPPGHAITRRGALSKRSTPAIKLTCACGWETEPLHLSNVIGAINAHWDDVSPEPDWSPCEDCAGRPADDALCAQCAAAFEAVHHDA